MLIKLALGDYRCNVHCLIRFNFNSESRPWKGSTKGAHGYSKSTSYLILSYPIDLGAGRMYITYLSRNSYLIFLMHLLHHVDPKIAAGVHLVEIAR